MTDFLTTTEAAEKIGCSRSLLQKRCQDGTLVAIRIGIDYRISPADLDAWIRRRPGGKSGRPVVKPHQDILDQLDAWIAFLTGVSALAPDTIRTHQIHLRTYLRKMAVAGHEALTITMIFDRGAMMSVFKQMPPKSYATRLNTFNAVGSFGRFLIGEGHLPEGNLEPLKTLKPRRQVEPRRTHLKADDVRRLFDVIMTRSKPGKGNLTMAAIVACMVYGGLRVSEVCHLRAQDVDLKARVITIRHGKGGKDRRVGIGQALWGYLTAYQAIRTRGARYFLRDCGTPFERNQVIKRMQPIARRLGADITCHGLRRTFATLAANQGRPVNSLRIALGHANLETTQAYLRTSETEVVEAMKDW